MVKKSFGVCSIATKDKENVRSDSFLRIAMEKGKLNLNEDSDENEEDPFEEL